MKSRKWTVTTFLVLALTIQTMPVSAAPSASITIMPPLPNPAAVGNEVSFAIVIAVTDIVPGVSGADIYLGYDDTRVEPLTSPNGVVEALPDFFGPSNITWYELLPKEKCPGATNPCIHLVAAGPAQATHSGAAARFHFQCKAEGEAKFWALASKLVDKDGYQVNHTLADSKSKCGKPKPTVTITGTVFRQGTPANPNPGGGTLACSTVNGVFTDQSGKFKIELINPPSGAYPIRAEYFGYLVSATTINIPSNIPSGSMTIDAGPTTLCGGDVNADTVINILDIGTIVSKFGKTGFEVRSDPQDGCTDPDEPTDINDDSLVNISDLAIAAGNWGPKNNKGPTGWQTDLCDP